MYFNGEFGKQEENEMRELGVRLWWLLPSVLAKGRQEAGCYMRQCPTARNPCSSSACSLASNTSTITWICRNIKESLVTFMNTKMSK